MSIAGSSPQLKAKGNHLQEVTSFEKDGILCTLNFFTDQSTKVLKNTYVYLTWTFEFEEQTRFDGEFDFYYVQDDQLGYVSKSFPKQTFRTGVPLDFRIGTTKEVQKKDKEEFEFKYHFVLTPKTDEDADVVELEKRFTRTHLTDAVLVVNGKKRLHVTKSFLSLHSEFFHKLFTFDFKEKSMAEIPIHGVEFEDFASCLLTMNSLPVRVNDENAEKMLKMADRLMMSSVTKKVEQHLLTETDMRFNKMLILSDKYKMKKLEKKLMERIRSVEDAQKIYLKPDYHLFSYQLKATILEELMSACG